MQQREQTSNRGRGLEGGEEQLQLADVGLDAQQPGLVRVKPQVQNHSLQPENSFSEASASSQVEARSRSSCIRLKIYMLARFDTKRSARIRIHPVSRSSYHGEKRPNARMDSCIELAISKFYFEI